MIENEIPREWKRHLIPGKLYRNAWEMNHHDGPSEIQVFLGFHVTKNGTIVLNFLKSNGTNGNNIPSKNWVMTYEWARVL